MSEKCENCKWWKGKTDRDTYFEKWKDDPKRRRLCVRFPQSIFKQWDDSCGEWETTP